MPRRSAADALETREAILAAARRCFAAEGYAVSLDGIAAEAGVTRGAVHHHFDDKRTLFVEVFRRLEEEVDGAVVEAARAAPPPERIRAGCRALFEQCARPEYRRIAIADAPSVLGLETWYEIDRGYGMVTMRGGLRALTRAGLLDESLLEPLAVLLFGALTEASLVVGGGLTDVTVDALLDAFDLLLTGLVVAAPTTG